MAPKPGQLQGEIGKQVFCRWKPELLSRYRLYSPSFSKTKRDEKRTGPFHVLSGFCPLPPLRMLTRGDVSSSDRDKTDRAKLCRCPSSPPGVLPNTCSAPVRTQLPVPDSCTDKIPSS